MVINHSFTSLVNHNESLNCYLEKMIGYYYKKKASDLS